MSKITPPPSHVKLIFITLLLFALGACSFEGGPEAAQTDLTDLPKTLDEQFLAIGEEVPGFAGIYYDDDNNLVVNMAVSELQTASVSDVRAALVKEFGQEVFGTVETLSSQSIEPSLTTQEVKYSFEDLVNLLDEFEHKAEDYGVNIIDIDEKANNIYLGVENEEIAKKIHEAIIRFNIPQDAVTVAVEEAPIPMATTLNSKVRPTQGGIDISCTLGFNTTLNGIKGFITNSHCTDILGQVDSEQFYQGGEKVGYEIADPKFNGAGGFWCSLNRNCRYSDSAFIKYYSNIGVSIGKIARVSNKPGLEITPKNPLPVVGKRTDNSQLFSGRVVEKVGARTGVTAGKILRTCAAAKYDTGSALSISERFVCQWQVGASALGGDSGSPVYTVEGVGVRLSGIVWGGDSKRFLFSPITGIERDLEATLTVK